MLLDFSPGQLPDSKKYSVILNLRSEPDSPTSGARTVPLARKEPARMVILNPRFIHLAVVFLQQFLMSSVQASLASATTAREIASEIRDLQAMAIPATLSSRACSTK
jgi:hypothetical protein